MYQFLLTHRYLTSKVMPLLAALAVALCTAMVIIVWSVMGGFLVMLINSGRTLVGDVTRCASSNNLPRQKITFLFEVEAGTGKVMASLESPLGNAAFTSCAEKAASRKRFKKGRKYFTFHGSLNI